MPSEIIMENEMLIYKMSQKFYGAEKEDLIQAGFLGLTKAYQTFNPEFQTKFSTYAYPFIYGEMYEAATGNRSIRVKKPELKVYKSIMHSKELLESKFNRKFTLEEVCERMHVDYQYFLSILNSLSDFKNIDDDGLNLTRKEHIDDLILLKESLETLSDLEQQVIVNRYVSDLTQDETAKVLGLSQVKISRLEHSSKDKIKNFIAS